MVILSHAEDIFTQWVTEWVNKSGFERERVMRDRCRECVVMRLCFLCCVEIVLSELELYIFFLIWMERLQSLCFTLWISIVLKVYLQCKDKATYCPCHKSYKRLVDRNLFHETVHLFVNEEVSVKGQVPWKTVLMIINQLSYDKTQQIMKYYFVLCVI